MMNPNICIYKITNLVNNKIYIGQTITGINSRYNTLFRIAKEIGHKFPTYRQRQKLGI